MYEEKPLLAWAFAIMLAALMFLCALALAWGEHYGTVYLDMHGKVWVFTIGSWFARILIL